MTKASNLKHTLNGVGQVEGVGAGQKMLVAAVLVFTCGTHRKIRPKVIFALQTWKGDSG